MKSVFEKLKEDICKEIMKTKTLTELKKQLEYILEEWDLTEEKRYNDEEEE